MRLPGPPWVRNGWRLVSIPLLLLALYLVLRLLLEMLSQRQGFGSPDGAGLGYLVVLGAVAVLRVTLLVIVPAVFTYRAVVYAITRFRRPDPGAPAPGNPNSG